MEALSGSNNLKCEPPVPVEGRCDSQTGVPLSSVKNEGEAANSHELTLSVCDPDAVVDIVNSRSNELVEVAVDIDDSRSNELVEVSVTELQPIQGIDSGFQAIQSNHKGIGPWRSSEDGYNWRKYGQKIIKGSEFPRSYYKCSHPNCQVRKQVKQSHDGQITDVIYKGKHDHPKPQPVSQVVAGTILSVQGEKSNDFSFTKSTEDKSSNGYDQTSHHPKPNGVPEFSTPNGIPEVPLVVASEKNVGANAPSSRIRDEIESDDDPESKRRCLKLNKEMTSYSGPDQEKCKESMQAHQCQSQANENVNAADAASYEMSLSVTVSNPPIEIATPRALVPVEVDFGDSQQRQGPDIGVEAMQIDHKGSSPSILADRSWVDGYNWRKYGQKHIKGSEFPRSYYRCTHPNCQVKKQLERSHNGQITEIIYKGEHDHPKPQPSSHMAVGRILSIHEEGFERFSSLNHTDDKSSDGYDQISHHTELNGAPELLPVTASDNDVQSEKGSKLSRTNDKAEQNDDLDSKSNHQQCTSSVDVQGQCQSQTLVSSPSGKDKMTATSSHELTPSGTISNPPVYMVTSRGIVPVEVDSDDKRQIQGSDSGDQATESNHNELSLSMTERLLENAYHWRKYGQKNIKGSEFPRSYYRCTHPNCQVKMQLERSHDGRIIEIIYKGKHEHPKPQPVTRMAIGAILSLDEDRSDRIFSLNDIDEKTLNGHDQSSIRANPNCLPKLSPIRGSAGDVEVEGEKLNRSSDGIEDDTDPESKRRKKDLCDVDCIPVVRTPREPRLVVETLSEADVVDDGYRWQKYGRKMVKGNPYPRNYYRCSNGACSVKKHVERASNNPKVIITTYEGKHNHDLPPPRITVHDTAGVISYKIDSNASLGGDRSGELDLVNVDVALAISSSPENRLNEKQEILDVEPIQSHSNITGPDSSKVIEASAGDLNEGADQDRSMEDLEKSYTPSLNQSTDPDAENMES